MKKKTVKIIYIFSFIDRSLLNETIADQLAKVQDFETGFILLNKQPSHYSDFLRKKKFKTWDIYYTGKKNLPSALFKVFKILLKEKPDIINTNLFDANIAGLLPAWMLGIKVRILSRHHSSLHHVYHPRYVWLDKLLNSLATHIVSPSPSVSKILIEKENVKPEKITLIPHGLPIESFSHVETDRIAALQHKYFPSGKPFPVIGVISRFTHWKGIQYIISAFHTVLQSFPQAHLLLANARGNYSGQIKKLLSELPPGHFTLIDFEQDSPALYRLMDVFVHIPVDDHSEAYGQVYIESLASGIPSVFTLSGIANEFIEDGRNASVVPYKDSEAVAKAILRILQDDDYRSRIIKQGKADVARNYNENVMGKNLEMLFRNAVQFSQKK
jgi:glycosyltransferase involved in cell wall biosynthesis